MSTRVLVLVGLPGSGKSTFSNKLVQCRSNWKRVNQDDLRTRKNCEQHMRKYLKDDYSIVVDRCNFDEQQRKTWIGIAKEFNVPVDCLVFTANQQECGERIQERQNHPTGVHGEEGLVVLKKFIRNYQPPIMDHPSNEGFEKMMLVEPSLDPECTEERIDTILSLLQESPCLSL